MLRLTAAFTRSRWRRRTTSGAPLVSVVCSTVFPFLGAAVTRWCPGALDLYGSLHDLGSLRRHGSRVISGTPGPDGSLNLPGALDLLGCCAAGRRAPRRYELLRADAPSEDAHRRLASHALADLLERVFDEAVGANDLVPENELSLLEPPAQAHRYAGPLTWIGTPRMNRSGTSIVPFCAVPRTTSSNWNWICPFDSRTPEENSTVFLASNVSATWSRSALFGSTMSGMFSSRKRAKST